MECLKQKTPIGSIYKTRQEYPHGRDDIQEMPAWPTYVASALAITFVALEAIWPAIICLIAAIALLCAYANRRQRNRRRRQR